MILVMVTWAAIGCQRTLITPAIRAPSAPLPAQAPLLPFADNPDPSQCGIPEPDDRSAVATGEYEGKLVQPIVYLYDSHLRREVVGQIYPGAALHVELSQSNPELNYYFVRTVNMTPAQSGWIPEPFIQFVER
ncbi:MAG: hypothetical protein R3A44_06650 [Caldilineaceae bacterium]